MITFTPVKRLIALVVLASACGREQPSNIVPLSREPVSVRGWIADVEGTASSDFKTVETEAARRLELFQNTNLWIDNAPYVSGGVVETGAFMLLDVPPGDVTITFQAPGIASAQLVLRNVPGNADVMIPDAILRKNGTVTVADPARIAVRVPPPGKPGSTAVVAGHTVPVVETPVVQLEGRQNYPVPPQVRVPVATVK
jgi:hypothetical protein